MKRFVTRAWHPLLMLLLCCLALGCSKDPKPSPKLKPATIAPAGALRWAQTAQLLPPQSPLVITLRPSDALVRLDQLYEWLVAQPKMYKGNSEGMIQSMANVRKFIGGRWSFDPLTPKGWQSLGVDIKRPVYLGIYPLSSENQQHLREANTLLKTQLGDPNQPNYIKRLSNKQKQPPSLYKDLAARSRQSKHTNGLRVLLPILNTSRLLEQLDLLAKDLGLTIKTFKQTTNKKVLRVYHQSTAERPTIVIRIKDKTLIVDLLPDGFKKPEQTKIYQGAIELTKQIGFGRPHAPTPFDRPVVSIALNQRGFAQVLRHNTLDGIVENASRKSAVKRDTAIVEGLIQTHRNTMAWSTEVPGTSGVTYDLLAGHTDHVLKLRMNTFGVRQLQLPSTPAATTSLNIQQRALGMSVSTGLWSGKNWRSWLGVEAPYKLKELFAEQTIANKETFAYWLAAPVNIALLLTNLNEIIKLTVPLDFVPMYAKREDVQRIEWTTYGSLSGFVLKPKFVFLLHLKATLDSTDRDAFSASVQDSLSLLTEKLSGTKATKSKSGQSLKEGGPHTFNVPATHHLAPFTYHYQSKGKHPWILLGYNLSTQSLQSETLKLSKPTTQQTTYARLEPSSVLQLLSTYNTTQFANLDLNVLAQRIGPMTFEIQPRQTKGVSTLEYSFTLLSPPSLQK